MKINKYLFTALTATFIAPAVVAQTLPEGPISDQVEVKDSVAPRSPEAYKIDGVAAIVGNDVVLESDIEGAYMQMQLDGRVLDESDKCSLLEQLLTDKLLANQGEVDSLPVTDIEVANAVSQKIQALAQQAGSMSNMLALYQKPDEETLASDLTPIIRSMLFADAMKKKLIGDLNPSPDQVRRFFNRIPKDSLPEFEEEFELATLTIHPKPNEASVNEVIERLGQMKKDIQNGADFRTLAILYSDDEGSASSGGVYENVSKGQFVKPFEAAAFNLEEGEISDPVQTEYGYHLIQVTKRRGEQIDLRHILMRPKNLPDDVAKTQAKMDSIVAKIRSGELKFDDAVKKFSEDDATKYNNGNMLYFNPYTGESSSAFKVTELDRNLYYAVANLSAGQVSDPIYIEDMRGGDYYAVYYVRRHTERHRADYSKDFNKLKAMAKKELENTKLRDWVSKQSREVFVHINDDWRDCDFVADWGRIRRDNN